MGKRKNRGVITGVSEAEEPAASASPDPAPDTPVPAEPLGKLWTWTPADAPPEVPLVDRVAEVIRDVEAAAPVKMIEGAPVGVLWTWTPVETDAPPTLPSAPLFTPPAPEAELTTLRPVFALDPDLVLPSPALLAQPVLVSQLDEPWLLVPPSQRGAPRRARWAVLALVLATCAALPWVVPQIPDLFAEAVPEQSSTPPLPQPTFDPPAPVPSGGVKVNKSLAGKRLASAGTPLEVTVERLQVIKAPVVPISGQTGELIPPDDPELLGWWQEGARVGAARGTSIITGHTVSGGGGAFDHLGQLVAGDHVTVRTSAGTIEYIVRETQDLPVAELARKAESIFQQTGDGRLVLITCSDFDGRVYRSNSVVYASPLEDIPKRKK